MNFELNHAAIPHPEIMKKNYFHSVNTFLQYTNVISFPFDTHFEFFELSLLQIF